MTVYRDPFDSAFASAFGPGGILRPPVVDEVVLFTGQQPDVSYISLSAPIDLLDHEDEVITITAGIRSNYNTLCGVHRCGEGSVYGTVYAHPFLKPMPEPDLLVA